MKVLLSLGAVIAAAVILTLYINAGDDSAMANHAADITGGGNASKGSAVSPSVVIPDLAQVSNALAPKGADYVEEMIARMKREFGADIGHARYQVALKEFRDDLIRNYPHEGARMFEQIVRSAFPELADLIFQMIQTMESYEAWLLSEMLELNAMDLMAQQNILWDKRIEMFGDKAREIWDEELSAEDERNAAVMQTVNMLDGAHDIPMNERLMLLQQAFEQGYGQSVEGLVYDTTGVMSQVFFRFDSVQSDLRALPPSERQARIDDIRRQMGYDETQVFAMAEADQQKEARWINGYAYMKARGELSSRADGSPEQTERLAELREKYFGNEAYTIGKEEDDLGFYRYERPRVFGWN